MSQIRDIVLDPNVFKGMPNLKFLRFYTSWDERSRLHLTRGLHFLPSGLRYLYWDKYPLESLPTDFDAKELLVLHLPNSNIKQIFKVKGAGRLKEAVQSLIESPLICRVINIASRILPSGIGNIKVPSYSCQFLSKITRLDMKFCQNLKSFPNNVDLQCLEILILWGCSNLKIFPKISTNLRILNVGSTTIKEVYSSSIEGLSRLQELNMKYCEKLESLPSNICKLQALQKLDLYACLSLRKFPEILEPMYNLRKVLLSFSGIEAIPSSIDNVKGLQSLFLQRCFNLACFPESFGNCMRGIRDFAFSTNLLDFADLGCPFTIDASSRYHPEYFDVTIQNIDAFSALRSALRVKVTIDRGLLKQFEMASLVSECIFCLIDLPSHPCLRCLHFLSQYYILDLLRCSIRELPKDLGSLYYLRELDLRSNNFVEIPATIKQLFVLESLRLDDCRKLRSLPQLPTSLCRLIAVRCGSLKTLLAFKQPIFNGGKMDFLNCLKLEEKECEAMAYKLLRNGPKDVYLYYPGSRSPEWFRHQTTGDIIRIKLPSNWFFNRRFFGFAFCVVYDSLGGLMYDRDVEFKCYLEDNYNPTIRFTYQTNFNLSHPTNYAPKHQHVLVGCLHDFNVWISERRHLFHLHCINMASFKFFIRGNEGKIKKCGITPLYMQDDEDEDEYDDDENAYWMLQSAFLTEMSTNEDDEEDMNSGDADEVCSLRLGSHFISQPLRTPRRYLDLEQTEMFHELTEKRKATVEGGSKIKRKREASA